MPKIEVTTFFQDVITIYSNMTHKLIPSTQLFSDPVEFEFKTCFNKISALLSQGSGRFS